MSGSAAGSSSGKARCAAPVRPVLKRVVEAGPDSTPITDLLEAGQLLERRLGYDRVAAEPAAAGDLVAACAYLPLALAIVAARAAIRPAFPLAALAAELHDSHARLDVMAAAPDADVRAVFSWSYDQLAPPATRLFRLLSMHPGPTISAPAAASLVGLSRREVHHLLAELTRAYVLDEPAPGRYACHDLLRTYATERARAVDSAGERRQAQVRLLDHYVHSAKPAAQLLNPTQDPIELAPPAPGVSAEEIATSQQAMTWFAGEHEVLLAAIDGAAAAGFDAHAWQLVWALANHIDRLGRWHERVRVHGAALEAARRMGDLAAQARSHRNVANGLVKVGRFDDGRAHLEQALRLCAELGDHPGQAHTHRVLAMLHERQGRHEPALQHAQQALALYESVDHRAGLANVHNEIGWYQAQLGNYDQTLAACKHALALLEEFGDVTAKAATWDTIGWAHHQLGDYPDAIASYQRSLAMLTNLVQRDDLAVVLDHLGDSQHASGDRPAARETWQRSLEILDDLGHPIAGSVRAKLRYRDPPA